MQASFNLLLVILTAQQLTESVGDPDDLYADILGPSDDPPHRVTSSDNLPTHVSSEERKDSTDVSEKGPTGE